MEKTIRIKKRGGGYRNQRVKVLKSGKYKFVKNSSKSRSRPKSKVKTKTTKKRKNVKRMAKKKRVRSAFSIRNIEKMMGFGVFIAPAVGGAKRALDNGWGIDGALDQVCQSYSGYSFIHNRFDASWLAKGWLPYLSFSVVSKAVHKLNGIIRRL